MNDFLNALLFLILMLGLIAFYLLPAIVAGRRHLANEGSIAIINILLGWTLLGWVIALAMAASGTAIKRANSAPLPAPPPKPTRTTRLGHS